MIVQFLQCKTSVCEVPNWNMQGYKLQFGSIQTEVLYHRYSSTCKEVLDFKKLNIPIVSCKNVRTYVAFSYNNLYRTSPLPTDL
jgi:hypothetical protein